MTGNVTDLFGQKTPAPAPEVEPSYSYTITLKDGNVRQLTGYLVVNSLFAAICRGEGVIYWSVPFDRVEEIVNNGEIEQKPGAITLN